MTPVNGHDLVLQGYAYVAAAGERLVVRPYFTTDSRSLRYDKIDAFRTAPFEPGENGRPGIPNISPPHQGGDTP